MVQPLLCNIYIKNGGGGGGNELLYCWVHSHAPSIRSHRGTKVVWPDFQPMRVPEEPVCVHLFRQNPVFSSLHLKSPVHVVQPLFSTLVILLPINITNSMKIMLLLTFYALLVGGEGLGLKGNRERRGYTQFFCRTKSGLTGECSRWKVHSNF